jgi:hypothetical protein
MFVISRKLVVLQRSLVSLPLPVCSTLKSCVCVLCLVPPQLHQQDTRCTGAPEYIDTGITILQQHGPGEKPTLVACTGLEVDRQVQLEVR